MSGRSPARDRAPLTERKVNKPMRIAAWFFGLVFLGIGVMGFIPGVTRNATGMGAAGPDSPALLFGLFQVSLLLNMVHLGLGAAGVTAAAVSRRAAEFLFWGGVVCAVLWLYGLLVPSGSAWNFVPLNGADAWLHLGFAVSMLALSFLLVHRGPLPDAPLDFEENVWAHRGEGIAHSQVGRLEGDDHQGAQDPQECAVCKAPLTGEVESETLDGTEYHFCSQWCREQFLRVPQRFAP